MNSSTLTLKTSNFRKFLSKVSDLAREALELHLQNCQAVAETFKRK